MKTFISKCTVEWVHCDAAGIVFYPHFYIWFDQGTERLFKSNGLTYPGLAEKYNLAGMPLLESGAQYQIACKHGAELEIHSWVDEWAAKTYLVKHRIFHADGNMALEGFERRVWAIKDEHAPKGMRAGPIPEEIKALFVD